MKYELIHTRSHLVVRIYSKYHHRETITIQSITKIFKISRVLPKLVSPLIFKNFLYYHYCITTQILDFLRYHHYLPKLNGQSITKNKTNVPEGLFNKVCVLIFVLFFGVFEDSRERGGGGWEP